MDRNNESPDLQELNVELTEAAWRVLEARLGLKAEGGLQLVTLKTAPLGLNHCALCTSCAQTNSVVRILYDGLDEIGNVCDACVNAGPAEMSRQAMAAADQLDQEAKRQQFLGMRLAGNLKRLDHAGATNEPIGHGVQDDAVERHRVRDTLANWHRGIKQASK